MPSSDLKLIVLTEVSERSKRNVYAPPLAQRLVGAHIVRPQLVEKDKFNVCGNTGAETAPLQFIYSHKWDVGGVPALPYKFILSMQIK